MIFGPDGPICNTSVSKYTNIKTIRQNYTVVLDASSHRDTAFHFNMAATVMPPL